MPSFRERAQNATSQAALQEIVNEAKKETKKYALNNPTKIRVTTLADAKQIYEIKKASQALDVDVAYKTYVDYLLDFADYVTDFNARTQPKA